MKMTKAIGKMIETNDRYEAKRNIARESIYLEIRDSARLSTGAKRLDFRARIAIFIMRSERRGERAWRE